MNLRICKTAAFFFFFPGFDMTFRNGSIEWLFVRERRVSFGSMDLTQYSFSLLYLSHTMWGIWCLREKKGKEDGEIGGLSLAPQRFEVWHIGERDEGNGSCLLICFVFCFLFLLVRNKK